MKNEHDDGPDQADDRKRQIEVAVPFDTEEWAELRRYAEEQLAIDETFDGLRTPEKIAWDSFTDHVDLVPVPTVEGERRFASELLDEADDIEFRDLRERGLSLNRSRQPTSPPHHWEKPHWCDVPITTTEWEALREKARLWHTLINDDDTTVPPEFRDLDYGVAWKVWDRHITVIQTPTVDGEKKTVEDLLEDVHTNE